MRAPIAGLFSSQVHCMGCVEEAVAAETISWKGIETLLKANGNCFTCGIGLNEKPRLKYVHSNPLTKDYSITRLIGYLHLTRKRVIQLLDNDQIYLNDFGEICIHKTGQLKYRMNKERA